MLILCNLDLFHLSMISMSLSKPWEFALMSANKEPLGCVLKKDCFVKACSSSFHDNNDEDLKVTDVSPIKSLFCNMNLDNDGTGDESTLVKRRPNDS